MKDGMIEFGFGPVEDKMQGIISSHTKKHIAGISKTWYERLKVITLPRELVIQEYITAHSRAYRGSS